MVKDILQLTKDSFEKEISSSDVPVIVDFWATWCIPCKKMIPIFEEISKLYKDRCKFAKVNIDDAVEITSRFNIMNIPTIIFFKQGKEWTRIVGIAGKDDVIDKIKEMIIIRDGS